jgi:hypothetical protein
MAYQINKTDGSKLVDVADGTINSAASSLTLIGKNFSGFGEYLNENLVKLLENFANVEEPSGTLVAGQLWFDTSLNSLKVYTGTEWRSVGSANLSDNQPATLRAGDLWFDTLSKQLYFNSGDGGLILIGPDYSFAQGKSGVEVKTVKNTLGQDQTLLYIWISGILLGIFSKSSFTLQAPIEGFTGLSIQTGFNLASFSDSVNFKIRATSTNADRLGGILAESFVRKDEDSVIAAQLAVTNGLRVGPVNSALNLVSTNGYADISNTANNLPLTIGVRATGDVQTVFSMDPITETTSVYPNRLSSTLAVGGSVSIDGNLTVRGSTTTITTTELIVRDKLIELNRPEEGTVTDEDADGGGIVLKGDTDHSIIWSETVDDINGVWTSSEHFNLATGKKFYIDGVEVLSGTQLSSAITSAPGLTSFGTQSVLNIGPDNATQLLRISGTTISTLETDEDLNLSPNGTGNVALVGLPKITGLGSPTDDADATTKKYVDDLVTSKNFAFSLDVTGINDTAIISILNDIAPVSEYSAGAIARISTTRYVESAVDYTPTIDKTLVEVTGTDAINYSVLRDISIPTASIQSGTDTVIRGLKQFQVQIIGSTKTWVHVSTEDNITYPRP